MINISQGWLQLKSDDYNWEWVVEVIKFRIKQKGYNQTWMVMGIEDKHGCN